MTKRKGRKPDTRVNYSLEQTQRYKSQWSRYQKGLELARSNLIHKIDDDTYRVPSERSPVGYWEISKKQGGGKITLRWEGEKREEENFENRIFSGCRSLFKVWVGWGFRYKNPYLPGGGFNYDPSTLTPISFDEFYINYCEQAEFTGTRLQALTINGTSGAFEEFPGGYAYQLASAAVCSRQFYPKDCYFKQGAIFSFINSSLYPNSSAVIARISQSSFVEPHFQIVSASSSGGESSGSCQLPYKPEGEPQIIKKSFNCEYNLTAEEFSPSWTVLSESGIIQNDLGYQKSVSHCPPPEPLSNIKLKAVVKIESKVESGKLIVGWQGEGKCKNNPPPTPSIGNYKNFNISGCEPSWNMVVSFTRKGIGFDANGFVIWGSVELEEYLIAHKATFNSEQYSIEEIVTVGYSGDGTNDSFSYGTLHGNVYSSFRSPNGTFYSIKSWSVNVSKKANNLEEVLAAIQSSTVTAFYNQVPIRVAKVYPPRGNATDNCELFDYDTVATPGSPPNCKRKPKVSWECSYPLSNQEFSLIWAIAGDTNVRNDKGYIKYLAYCPPPESNLEEIKIISVRAEGGKGDWECNCPDFSKQEGAFVPPSYPSQSQPRDWAASEAGAPTWSDSKRRCYHIVGVQHLRGENVPIPTDFPIGEA